MVWSLGQKRKNKSIESSNKKVYPIGGESAVDYSECRDKYGGNQIKILIINNWKKEA